MKNRLILAVGAFLLGTNITKAGMKWEEWTPENGIEDGRAALQEMLDAGKMPDENWQEKALAFINAFEKLKLQLQFFWRSRVGDGATDGNPWNGVSDGCKPAGEYGYIKKDCPIVLHFWMDGHIGKYRVPEGYYAVSRNDVIPLSTTFTEKDYSKLKGKLKKYIFVLFEMKDLKKCAIFLNQNFCRPVAKLVNDTIEKLKTQTNLKIQDLKILFKLYGVYDCIDFRCPIVIQEKHNETQENICAFIADCCYNDMNQFSEECKLWFTSLFANYNKNPYKENAGLGQYNLYLTKILEEFASKMKKHPKGLSKEFVNIMKSIAEEWQQWLNKYRKDQEDTKKVNDWHLSVWALEDALY